MIIQTFSTVAYRTRVPFRFLHRNVKNTHRKNHCAASKRKSHYLQTFYSFDYFPYIPLPALESQRYKTLSSNPSYPFKQAAVLPILLWLLWVSATGSFWSYCLEREWQNIARLSSTIICKAPYIQSTCLSKNVMACISCIFILVVIDSFLQWNNVFSLLMNPKLVSALLLLLLIQIFVLTHVSFRRLPPPSSITVFSCRRGPVSIRVSKFERHNLLQVLFSRKVPLLSWKFSQLRQPVCHILTLRIIRLCLKIIKKFSTPV